MQIEKNRSDLLYRYQCVTVPDFGAFLAQTRSAEIVDVKTHTFYPPTKTISFSSQLVSNDGLLAKYISDVEQISYEEALTKIEQQVLKWKTILNKNEKVYLRDVGEIWLEEGKMQFQPTYGVNYLTSSFGMTSFVTEVVIREELKEKVEVLEEKTPILFTPEKRKSKPYLKYAAVFLIAASAIGFGITKYNGEHKKQNQIVEQQAQEEVQKNIQQATFFDASPVELPEVTLNLNFTSEILKYHVVAGAFRIEENADKKVNQLLAKGFNANRIGKNKYGLHQVSYDSFSDVDEALTFLREVKRTDASEAWLLVAE